eukprot:2478704-Pleurochrysis_carterae.AAC.8
MPRCASVRAEARVGVARLCEVELLELLPRKVLGCDVDQLEQLRLAPVDDEHVQRVLAHEIAVAVALEH